MNPGDKPLVWLEGEVRSPPFGKSARIVYRADSDAVIIAEVFKKKTARTPDSVIKAAKRRLKDYDNA